MASNFIPLELRQHARSISVYVDFSRLGKYYGGLSCSARYYVPPTVQIMP